MLYYKYLHTVHFNNKYIYSIDDSSNLAVFKSIFCLYPNCFNACKVTVRKKGKSQFFDFLNYL